MGLKRDIQGPQLNPIGFWHRLVRNAVFGCLVGLLLGGANAALDPAYAWDYILASPTVLAFWCSAWTIVTEVWRRKDESTGR